ncbi:hypothetical protein [Nocardiopsis salina]|nr:hypothetical protein [Nocardiopsis salina]
MGDPARNLESGDRPRKHSGYLSVEQQVDELDRARRDAFDGFPDHTFEPR